ncbi:hypothetical protein GCM10014715_80690 [Streptomyces spiralis]|uniref:Uncharacterized protein n=1 Tax=Streptomyces spiralis TaxID=66376 RepID=A0A919AJY3_9ACTN|nr:hypothetical protein GCM10014715_80690 [Streptomyces spiralis]
MARPRGRGAAVLDLAGEGAVVDETQPYGWDAVPQSVGDQLADDLQGVVSGVLVHAPSRDLVPGVPPCEGGGGGLFVQRPGGYAVGGEGVGAGEKEDGVAGHGVGAQPVQDVVTQVLEGPAGVANMRRSGCGSPVPF